MDHDDLILRFLQGRSSVEEEMTLREWRTADPENEKTYQDSVAVWRATRDCDAGVVTEPPRLETITSPGAVRHRSRGPVRRRAVQAAVIAAAFMAGLALTDLRSEPPAFPDRAGEIVTGVGETATTRLPDGTVVRLAPESRLVLPTSTDARSVTLDGQAFFAVSADPENPFLVRTPSGDARVLGTRFELDARRGQLRLLVVEGRVAVASGNTQVDVEARQMAHLRAGEAPSTVEVEDVWPLLDWMGDFLAFESTSLREVGREFERRFDVTLHFEDPRLAEETVTVWFRDEPIEEVVSVLCRLMETQCTMDNSRVRMSRAP